MERSLMTDFALDIPASPAHFALATSRGHWLPAPHLALINRIILEVAYSKVSRFIIISVPPRHGKGLDLETPIPTPTGWVSYGDLAVGDDVFGGDGRPCKVVALSPVWNLPCYDVTTDSGDLVTVDAPHEWLVTLDNRTQPHRHETQVLATRKGKAARVSSVGLQLPDVPLLIDPYVLGVWLGDGTSADAAITSGAEDIAYLRGEIEKSYPTRLWKIGTVFGVLGLRPLLRELGVFRNKHIPPSYLRASAAQRLALLQGLIDTDGYVAPEGQIEFSTTNERLRDGVAELVRSLGVKAQIIEGRATLSGQDCGPKWRIMFYMANAARIPRKASRCRDASPLRRRHYLTFKPSPSRPTRCIQVDSPDHLFLVGRTMLPTSNSWLLSRYTTPWYLGHFPDRRVILTSYDTRFAERWGRDARNLLEEYGERMFGVKIAMDSAAAGRWDIVGHEGGMNAVGMGGELTGRGGNLIIIDDPVKDWESSLSENYRRSQWDWYLGTLRPRLEPNGSIILLMCLAGDSLVPVVGKGSVPISQIVPGDEVYAYSEEGLTRRRVLAQRRSGVGETITIATHRHQLTATPTHPFLVVPADGRARPAYAPVWRPAASLTVGDLVVTSAALPTSGAAPVDGWTDPEWAWLLGYLVGDGWVTTWPKHNKDHVRSKVYDSRAWAVFVALGENATLNERAADLIYSIFGRRPKAHLAEGYQRLDSAEAGRTLTALGLVPGVRAPAKRVPLWLFDAPGETQLAFLRGLLDADGHKDKIGHAWTLASSSLELCGDVCRLALCCGARPAGPWTEKGRWRQPPNSPSPVWSQGSHVTIVMPEDDQRGRSLVTGRIPPDVRLERVQKITPGPILDVYDLTVDGEANFVAEGFVVHNTRWNEDDLAARLMQASADNPFRDQWEQIRLPALAEPSKEEMDAEGYDPETWRDVLGRKIGDPLWPARWSLASLMPLKETLESSGVWDAEYQQRPSNPHGDMFPVDAWKYVDAPPAGIRWLRSWDLAATEKKGSGDPDWTASVLIGIDTDSGVTYVADARRKREDALAIEQFLQNTAREDAEKWGCKRVRIPQDPGQAGKAQINYLIRKVFPGYNAGATLDSGDKVSRVTPFAAQQRAGNVCLVRGEWNRVYVEEFRTFPGKGRHDDFVDATSAGYTEVAGIGHRRRTRLLL